MNDPFEHVPVEEDTRIISRLRKKLENLDVMLEYWSWDGIAGNTVVFLEEQVKHLTNDQIIEILSRVISVGKNFTITRKNNGYVFVNFGFEPESDKIYDVISKAVDKAICKNDGE